MARRPAGRRALLPRGEHGAWSRSLRRPRGSASPPGRGYTLRSPPVPTLMPCNSESPNNSVACHTRSPAVTQRAGPIEPAAFGGPVVRLPIPATSTSPGGPRSSHGTSTGSSARAPSSGIDSQAARASKHRVPADAAVRRCHDVAAAASPRPDHPLDRLGRELGPVREHHDRGLHRVPERREPAAERRPRPALPLRAPDDSRVRLDLVRAEDDDDLPHGRGLPHAPDHLAAGTRPASAATSRTGSTPPPRGRPRRPRLVPFR